MIRAIAHYSTSTFRIYEMFRAEGCGACAFVKNRHTLLKTRNNNLVSPARCVSHGRPGARGPQCQATARATRRQGSRYCDGPSQNARVGRAFAYACNNYDDALQCADADAHAYAYARYAHARCAYICGCLSYLWPYPHGHPRMRDGMGDRPIPLISFFINFL